ncbi:unnamed protein product [Anisakis simplex]|uniref:Putative ATP synthase subunit f, mitochondrial (inferred by orthology to a C. elegans protein) n=1 Tax=Anisakis simplex TaxID=6269 RepID=A0A0M3JRB4_ANISI|nr:unnamed protein product [Anisakis simplex]
MFRPPPPGTKLTPWVPDLIFIPISRAFERVGVYFYNRVISRTNIGLYDKRWNKRVHGPYCHWRYYGKPDTRLLDVKISDLKAWIGRREKTPSAVYNEFVRNVWRVHNLYYSGPVFNNTVNKNDISIRIHLFIFELAGEMSSLLGLPKDDVPLVIPIAITVIISE